MPREILARAKEAKLALNAEHLEGAKQLIDIIIELAEDQIKITDNVIKEVNIPLFLSRQLDL